jgi:endonuclease YncB( thermonuclease family)
MELSNFNPELVQHLQNCEVNNTPEFIFADGLIKLVKVIDVYDGDTITVAMCIHPNNCDNSLVYKFKIRLYGYNTEEIKQPKNDPNRNEKKEWAIYQRNWIREQILNKLVLLECLGYDKYGRILGKIYLDYNRTQCINNIIVNKGIAPAYLV